MRMFLCPEIEQGFLFKDLIKNTKRGPHNFIKVTKLSIINTQKKIEFQRTPISQKYPNYLIVSEAFFLV